MVQTWNGTEYEDTDPAVTVSAGGTFTVLKSDARIKDADTQADVAASDVNEDGSYTYTVQLKAVHKDKEEATPTHIDWYKNDGTAAFHSDTTVGTGEDAHPLKINEAVDIQGVQTRAGYTFLGWARVEEPDEVTSAFYTQTLTSSDLYLYYNASDNKYYTTSSFTTEATQVAADEATPYHAMFAVWEANKYTVTLVDEDGTTVLKEATAYDYGTAAADIEKPADPTKAATAQYTYTFAGWTPEVSSVTGDATYTAQWKDDNNGTPDEDENFTITYPEAGPDEDGDGEPDVVTPTEETIPVPYDTKIEVDPNGGTWRGSTEKQTITVTGDLNLKPDPTREGYVFAGWKRTDGTDGIIKYVFTAQWAEDTNNNGIPDSEEFVVIYNLNGGTTTSKQTTFDGLKEGDDTPRIVDPTRSGYRFIGWDPEVKSKIEAPTTTQATLSADTKLTIITYTAIWTPLSTIPDSTSSTTPTQNLPSDSLDPESTSSEPSTTNENPTEVIDDGDVPMADYEDLGEEIEDLDVPLAVWGLNDVDHYAYIIGYDDQTVRPNNQITRAEVATIFFRLLTDEVREENMTSENSFSDVSEGQWFNKAVSTMAAMGVLTGYPDGTFRPNQAITRAEFASIAARFDLNPADGTATFSDTVGHWAEAEISKAVRNGWVNGYPDGTFLPDQPITRAEAMALINRMLERNPAYPEDLCEDMNRWIDNSDETKWYYLDVQEATNSHTYVRLADGTEIWIDKMPDRDWAELER